MKFLFPYFLFALVAVAIPIIIHLFNFRRFVTVYFSNVDFLKNIKKESHRKSKLKQLLILIARIMAIICLVFAFAQPYFPLNNREQNKAGQVVAVYIDNSYSLNTRGQQGQLLETARNRAIEIAREYKPGTRFLLVTNDLLPKHRNPMNSEQFIQQVTEIGTSPNVVPISKIYSRMKETFGSFGQKDNRNLFVLSDFQRSMADVENIAADSTVWTYLLPFTPQVSNNLYIDSCWFETPSRKLNGEEELFVKIKNGSDQDYNDLPLKFYLNDSLKSLTSFNIGAQAEIKTSLKFTNITSGFQRGKVELIDYPVTHDNSWYLSFNVQPDIRVLAICNQNSRNNGLSYLKALFSDDDYTKLDVEDERSVQISRLGDYNTIILANLRELSSGFITELEQAVSNGASILFFPEMDGNLASYNQFLSRFGANTITGSDTVKLAIAGVAYDNPVYAGIFKDTKENAKLPEIKGHLKFSSQTQIAETKLLWFGNGEKALGSVAHGNGFFHVFSFPLNKNNEVFAKDILFVPTVYSLVLNSIARQDISYTVGRDQFVLVRQNRLPEGNFSLLVRNMEKNEEFIPETKTSDKNNLRIDLANRITNAGFYSLKTGDKPLVSVLAFNYDRAESDLRYFTVDELEGKISKTGSSHISVINNTGKQFSEIFDEIRNGKQLWKWFILMALFFIAMEAGIIRFWK
jgi:hypothetical protein